MNEEKADQENVNIKGSVNISVPRKTVYLIVAGVLIVAVVLVFAITSFTGAGKQNTAAQRSANIDATIIQKAKAVGFTISAEQVAQIKKVLSEQEIATGRFSTDKDFPNEVFFFSGTNGLQLKR